MNEPHTKPHALQMCPFSTALEEQLARRLTVVRWFDLDEAGRGACLRYYAGSIRAVITGGHIGCPTDLMEQLPSLGLVAINGVGFDKVDLVFAGERGVGVTNTPDVLTDDVADLAVGLVIAAMRRIPAGDLFVRGGHWPRGEMPLARKVSGSNFGVLGLGHIGRAIAHRLAAFGPVGYASPNARSDRFQRFENVEALAQWSDVLVVACAATPATRNLVDAGVLAALGPRGYLANISRGSVVDEEALIVALEAGSIAGAALDVYASEPNVPDGLKRSDSTVLTPHVASATVETRAAMANLVLANVDAFLAGHELPSQIR